MTRIRWVMVALAFIALLGGITRVAAQATGNSSPKQTQVVLDGQVLIVADSTSVVAYDAGASVEVKSSPDRFGEFLDAKFAQQEYCWIIGPRAKEKGYHLKTVTPLPDWKPCDQQSSSKIVPSTGNGAGGSQAASGGQDCTASTEQHDPVNGDWSLSNEGPMIVNFWTNKRADQGNYKLWLDAGSYSLPGGGTGFLYPKGCEDVARQQFGNNPLPATDLNQIQANIAAGSSGGEQSGSGQQDCTASNEKHDPDGNPWTVTSDGPMVVNVYVAGSSDTTEYKFLLKGGSYTFPANSGGDASLFPVGCDSAAGAAFDQDGYPAGDWNHVMSLSGASTTGAPGPGQGGQTECTSTTGSHEPDGTPWTVGTGKGQLIVNVYVKGSSDETEYKFLLDPGTYTFPTNSGGDYTEFDSPNCQDAAGQTFDADQYPKGDWNHVMSLNGAPATETPTQAPAQSGQDCTATTQKHDPDGNPWTISNDGPLVVNVYVAGSSNTTEYKFLLKAGSYTFPANSGGDASLFPQGCDDAAGAAYDNDGYTPGDWDHVQSLNATPATEVPTQATTQVATQQATDAAIQPTIQPQSTEIVTEVPTQAPTDPPATQASGQQTNTIKDKSSKIVPVASPRG